MGRRIVAARTNRSQVSERIANRGGREVQPSQLSTGFSKDFTTRLLPKIGTGFAPGTAPFAATTPTKSDLEALHGGPFSLLSVGAVAERLGVCAAAIYRLCERGELPHVRIVNSIRVRRADLDAFVAGSGYVATAWLSLLASGVLRQLVGWWLNSWGLGHVDVASGALALQAQQIATLFLAAWLLGEPLKPLGLLGGGLIMAGIVTMATSAAPARPRRVPDAARASVDATPSIET
jgi:excisionase family DNA binding protein